MIWNHRLPFGKAGRLQIHRYQGIAVDRYSFTLDASVRIQGSPQGQRNADGNRVLINIMKLKMPGKLNTCRAFFISEPFPLNIQRFHQMLRVNHFFHPFNFHEYRPI